MFFKNSYALRQMHGRFRRVSNIVRLNANVLLSRFGYYSKPKFFLFEISCILFSSHKLGHHPRKSAKVRRLTINPGSGHGSSPLGAGPCQ